MKKVLLVGGCLAILVCAVGLVAILALVVLPGSQNGLLARGGIVATPPSAESTPIRVASTPKRAASTPTKSASTPTKAAATPGTIGTPTPGTTPRPSPAIPTPTMPATLKVGEETYQVSQVLVAEDFSRNSRNWRIERVEGLYASIVDGQYYIEIRGSNVGMSSLITPTETAVTSDFALLANASSPAGSPTNVYGLLYGDGSSGEYYEFEISDLKKFRIRYWGSQASAAAEWQQVVDWQEAKALKPQGEWNHLGIIRRGTTVTFYLNGQTLHSIKDGRVARMERIGVYSGAWSEPTEVAFDNIYLATLR